MNCYNISNFCSNVCFSFLILLSSFCTTIMKSIKYLIYSLSCFLVQLKTDKLTSKSCIVCCWLLAKALMFLFMLSFHFLKECQIMYSLTGKLLESMIFYPFRCQLKVTCIHQSSHTDLYVSVNSSISSSRLSNVSIYPVKFDLL